MAQYSRVRLCNQLKNFRPFINVRDFPTLFTTKSGEQEFIGYVKIFFTYSEWELLQLCLKLYFVHYIITYYFRSATGFRSSLAVVDFELCHAIAVDILSVDSGLYSTLFNEVSTALQQAVET
jgi:hypothetical protein